jgi:hypothetical protein
MKNFLLICAIILLFASSCDDRIDDNYPNSYPCCLQNSINDILNNAPLTPRVYLSKYYYQEQYVYTYNGSNICPQCADFDVNVVNENCELVCYFGGLTNGKCEGWEKAEFIEVVWEDPR